MNNTSSSSEPFPPPGTTIKAAPNSLSAATTNNNSSNPGADKQKQDSDGQLPAKVARTSSLSDASPSESSAAGTQLQPKQPNQAGTSAPSTESLKVKIKTNNINNTIFATTTTATPKNDNNNNNDNKTNSSSISSNNINKTTTNSSDSTGNNRTNDNGSSGGGSSKPTPESPTISNKSNSASPVSTPKSTSSRAGGRKSKQNNGDTSSSTLSTSSSNNSSFSSTTGSSSPASSGVVSPKKAQPAMNNHESSSAAENGKKPATVSAAPLLPPPPAPLPLINNQQTSQVQPILPTQQLSTQSQQPPLPILPQPQSSTTQPPPPTLAPPPPEAPSAKPSTSQPATPKPKMTRAKKQTAANNKNANTSSATTPAPAPPISKPEAKTRTKKAKQTTESKAGAAASNAASSLTSSRQPVSAANSTPAPTATTSSSVSDKKGPTTPAKKRKPRAPPASDPNAQPTNPPKRTRKKKGDPVAPSTTESQHISQAQVPPMMSSNMTLPPLSVNPLLSVASNIPMGASPLMSNAPQHPYQPMQSLNVNRNMSGISPLDVHSDHNQRYVPVALSPYANHDYTNSLARQHSLSKLLFTSSSSGASAVQTNPHSDEIAKAFDELRDQSWSHLSKCILEPAQQFDIPSLIGTLYELRQDNEKQLKRVKDLTLQREQLAAMNAKLDLSGPMLLQNLNQTSPGFASVVAGLQNSPKSLPNSSPSPAMNKSPIVPGGAYNHVPPGSSLGPPGMLYDRNSPMVGLQTQHSGVNSLKSSMMSTPSPPTSAFMAHGANNRAGLMTVNNSPYMSNVHPSMSALGGPAPPSYYPRQ